jgi:hypothetical protein
LAFRSAAPDRAPTSFGLTSTIAITRWQATSNIWELNRHQHLTVLAAAYSITKDALRKCHSKPDRLLASR